MALPAAKMARTDERPVLAITMGDPTGIGPEIAIKALSRPRIYDTALPLVVGDARVMESAVRICGLADKIAVNPIRGARDGRYSPGVVDVYHLPLVEPEGFVHGRVAAVGGEAAFRCVAEAIGMAMDGQVDAVITNPLNKEALNLAGRHYSGHTEIFADLTGTKDYAMMLADRNFRVVHVSTHVSLREACDRVRRQRVQAVIQLTYQALRELGINDPLIGVAGLNPHAGEGGLFGWEEIEEIIPAIEAARQSGMRVDGPVPPDTVFAKARGGQYDAVVAMYHDQGHIPMKTAGFVLDATTGKWTSMSGVNVTLGLPIIRTSVDHGTAFGKAGKGTASEQSLVEAMEMATAFALGRRRAAKEEAGAR